MDVSALIMKNADHIPAKTILVSLFPTQLEVIAHMVQTVLLEFVSILIASHLAFHLEKEITSMDANAKLVPIAHLVIAIAK